MTTLSVHDIVHLVSERTGWHVPEKDAPKFHETISGRMKCLKLTDPHQYYRLLETNTAASDLEWEELTLQLTIGESYFFRDKGQMQLLQERILPDLIQKRGARHTLRIWSAGCSTGEEPYTLAMMIDHLLPVRGDWSIFILGTDINKEAISKAQRGVYTLWSFRLVDPNIQARHFHERNGSWEMDERIRSMVTFRMGNLLQDEFPNYVSDIHDLDLIICRNVFIYFDKEAVSVVIRKFTNGLTEEGYLLTGHNELHGQNLGRLRARFFPESVIYQRGGDVRVEKNVTGLVAPAVLTPVALRSNVPIQHAKTKDVPVLREPPQEARPAASLLLEAEKLMKNGAYAAAVETAEGYLNTSPGQFPAHYLIGRAAANLGEYDKAAHHCQFAIEIDPFAVNPYYLMVHISEQQGRIPDAISYLKKILYLSPSFVAAYLELGALYERDGEASRARKMRITALQLLKELRPDAVVESCGELTAGELTSAVEAMLR